MFVLLPIALLFSAAAVGVFLWASASGQFDDLETPALRMLHDDQEPRRAAPAPATETTSAEGPGGTAGPPQGATATLITPSR